jgi:hypothetical protein
MRELPAEEQDRVAEAVLFFCPGGRMKGRIPLSTQCIPGHGHAQ